MRKAGFLYLSDLFRIVLFSALVFVFFGSTAKAQSSLLKYRGFNVTYEEIANSPNKDSILESTKSQIEIIEKVGLKTNDLEFFKSVPIIILANSQGSPGVYNPIKKTVSLKGRVLDGDKPILLHELLHAYHHQHLPQGKDNAQIIGFYTEAQNIFPEFKGEYFLSNKGEFFAVTASIYLFGKIVRPPSERQTIKEKQPAYFNFLAGLFGEKK